MKNLRVGEVSLVDRPAIEREFLVIKADTDPSEGEPNMSEEKKSVAQRAIEALKSLAGGGSEMTEEEKAAEAKKAADEKIVAEKKAAEAKKSANDNTDGDDKDAIAKAREEASAETRAEVAKEYEVKFADLEKSLEDVQLKSATADFRAMVIEKKWPGDADVNAALCVKMSALDDDTFKGWVEGQNATAALLTEAKAATKGLFVETGKSATGESIGEAIAKVAKDVSEVEIKAGENVFNARRKVIRGTDYVRAQAEAEDAKPARK